MITGRKPGLSDRQDIDRAGRCEADYVGQPHFGVGDLALFGALVLGQMPDHFADVGHAGGADRMAFGEQAARYVDRYLTAQIRMLAAALIDELAGLAFLAQEQVLVMDQLGAGETVVQFGQ